MASLFSKLSSLIKEKPSDSIMDDNVALSSKDTNPYISPVAVSARNAYDTLHNLMAPLIEGKKASLKQIDKWLKDWTDQLDKVRQMYEEMLAKIKDLSSNFEGAMTLDFAKEAWEMVQDTPILRRYMGEANYWYLYSTLGLLATQTGSMAADMTTGVKELIKKSILALISMTNGLLCVESYLGMIQQYWGGLYVKFTPIPLLDSIVPNVTCAYWYKPPIPSLANDGVTVLQNNPPDRGFTPIPLPIPRPEMALKSVSYIKELDMQNPETWYYEGGAYYVPRTMELLQRALEFWGSSYTDAWLPAVNYIYPRREYGDGGKHPLITGKTFAQLDTDKNVIKGSNVSVSDDGESDGADISPDIRSRIESIFTDDVITAMRGWQESFILARTALRNYLLAGFEAYGEKPSTISQFIALQDSHPEVGYTAYETWRQTDTDFVNAINMMLGYWQQMVAVYMQGKAFPTLNDAYRAFFDDVMCVFTSAGQALQGTDASLEETQVFAVAPSYAPDTMTNITDDLNTNWGECFVAYRLNKDTGKVFGIGSGGEATIADDSIVGTYELGDPAFVMFPSDWKQTPYPVTARMTKFAGVAKQVAVAVVGVPEGLKVGDSTSELTGSVISWIYPAGMYESESGIVGDLPDALSMHQACGVSAIKPVYANLFFPDGEVAPTADDDVPPMTFVDVYDELMGTAADANEELADVVGYSIDHGRETKFPCFSVYGELLSMQSWHYKEMPFEKFNATYKKIKAGSSLYYKVADPSVVVYYHSSYVSQSRKIQIAVYHEYLEKTVKIRDDDSYTFYVFPCESVSVSEVPEGIAVGAMFPVDATAPDGTQYHYITMRNPIPKCAKYVDPEKWSLMDIIHEMYLLAENLADLCGDNGERLRNLQKDLDTFHISRPQFVGQLPDNNGQYVNFRFEIFKDYADRIEKLIDSVYSLRSQIIAATNSL